MDNVVGRLIYKITGDNSLLKVSLKDSRTEVAKTSDSFDKLSKQVLNFGSKVLTGVLIKNLADAASHLEELENKFNTVFKGVGVSTNAWIEAYSNATARGSIATKEFLTAQQDIRTGFGDTTERAAEFSKVIVGLTNDLASFSNISFDETMQAMQSVLAFQFEAGRRLGLGINVEIINQSNYAKALNKTWLEMSNLEKQEAVLSVALSQSQNAIHQNIDSWEEYNYKLGDAALTANSYANINQEFKQTLEDVSASLGQFILPTLTNVLNLSADILNLVADSPYKVKALIAPLGLLAITIKALGGPIGIAVGSLTALITLMQSARTPAQILNDQIEDLALATSNYKEATDILKNKTDELTVAQLALYEAQKKTARADALKALKDIAKTYKTNVEEINKASKALEYNKAEFDAYVIAVNNGKEGLQKALKAPYEASLEAQKKYKDTIESLLYYDKWFDNAQQFLDSNSTFLIDLESQYNTALSKLNLSIANIAQSLIDGIITENDVKVLNEDLFSAVMNIVDAQEKKAAATNEANAIDKKAITLISEYTDKLNSQRLKIAEANDDYKKVHDIKMEMLNREYFEAIKNLAIKSEVVDKEADLNSYTIENLEELIKQTEAGKIELLNIESYYKTEKELLDNEINEKEKKLAEDKLSSNREWNEKLLEQAKEYKQLEIQELLDNGQIEKAYKIKFELLKEQEQIEKKAIEERIKNNQAQAEDIVLIEQYYANEEIRLEKEKNDTIATLSRKAKEEEYQRLISLTNKINQEIRRISDAKSATAELYKKKLIEQDIAIRSSSASELIALGDFEKGYAIRIKLLDEEEKRELELLEEKLKKNEATEKDKTNLVAYYSKERDRINKEEQEAIVEYNKKAAEEEKKKWIDVAKNAISSIQSIMGSLLDISASRSNEQIALIKKQEEAQLEALGIAEETERERLIRELKEAKEKGDFETAIEKEKALQRLQIQQDNQKKIDKINIEQARKEKELAIFNATISMLQAAVKALADPGGFAGLALSALSLTTGAAQIAAIQSQPLPSYDVGAIDISEDHIAKVHTGEIVVPKSFAEGLRDGDLTLGKSANAIVNITVNNQAEVNVDTRAQTNDNGETDIIFTITKVVSSQIQRGAFDNSMISRYGIQRRGING